MTDQESNGQPTPPPPAAPREPSFAPLFALGQLLATPSALRTLEAFGVDPLSLVVRHVRGDWGDLCDSDRQLNEAALIDGSRIFSAYTLSRVFDDQVDTEKVWLITEADRRCSTFLLPSEY